MTKEKEAASDKRPGLGEDGSAWLFCSASAFSMLPAYHPRVL